LYFHKCPNVNLGPTGACDQEWKNLGVGTMVAATDLY